MSEKYDKITAHLVSAIETIASTYGDTPTMLQKLEGRLDKIREIYTNDSVSVDIKAGTPDDGCDSNPPASVSDEKSRWELYQGPDQVDHRFIMLDDLSTGILYNNIPAFRTLIAKEKLCDKMYRWMMKDSKLWSQFSCMTNDNLYKSQAENRNTLIAEYEEVK